MLKTSKIELKKWDQIKEWSYLKSKQWVQINLVPLGINSSRKYSSYKRDGGYLPAKFPRDIQAYFSRRNEWQNWNDFFGNEGMHRARKNFHPYPDCVEVVRKAGIKNSIEFRKWQSRPENIPSRPEFQYNEWKSWKSFLGDNYNVQEGKNNTKLTKSKVRIIKHQLRLGVPAAQLAKFFEVSDMQVIRIKRGENWAEVE